MPRKTKAAQFEMLPSKSLRVRLRINGFPAVSQTFPLFQDTPDERKRQRADAEAWAAATKRRMLAGTHMSTREAETLRLADALRRYRDEGLIGKPSNIRKDRNRIEQILEDPIALRPIAGLRPSDIANYRDELQQRAKKERGRELARTTISNKTQIITRALAYIGEKIEGVPDLTGVKMPKASPGRDRRVEAAEFKRLLDEAESINPLLSLIVRFAVLTALRRERILQFRLSNVHSIGQGKRVIRFPKDRSVKEKKAGIVPITRELQEVIDQALVLRSRDVIETTAVDDAPIFAINGNTLDKHWRRAVDAAKCIDLHFHDLRHEATSRLFERGLNFAEVMSITGHSTTEMVDRYSHYSAALVLEKLETKSVSPEDVASDFLVLLQNFSRCGGDVGRLQAMIMDGFAAMTVG